MRALPCLCAEQQAGSVLIGRAHILKQEDVSKKKTLQEFSMSITPDRESPRPAILSHLEDLTRSLSLSLEARRESGGSAPARNEGYARLGE